MVQFRPLLAVAGLAGYVLAGLVIAGPAAAGEWSLAADVEQRVEADSNFGLDDPSEGSLYGSTSTFDLRLGHRTKRTRWNLATGVRLSVFAGPGGDTGLDDIGPRVNGGMFHQGKRFSANAAFGFSSQSAAFTQFGLTQPPAGSVILPDNTVILPDDTVVSLDDFGTISSDNATRNSFDISGGVTFTLDQSNRLSLSASGTVLRFSGDEDELEDANSFGATVGWARDLTNLTTSSLSFGLTHFAADDDVDTESLTFTTTGGLETKLTPRLAMGIDAGFNVADIQRDPPENDDTAIGFNGGFHIDYQLAADTRASLMANQGFEPSSLGELQNRTTIGLLIEHSINNRSRFALSTSYSRQVSADNSNDTDRQLFVLSPSYSIDLTPDWRARMGYTFRLRDEDSDLAVSNNIFLNLSRSFNLLR